MAAPPIGKLSSAAFPVVMVQPRSRSGEGRARTDRGAAVPEDPNLELLEVAAGQVSESTGEPCTATPHTGVGADPAYRMELMGFIVGSLSRAVQAVRTLATAPAEPDDEAEEPVVEAALPEVALPEGDDAARGEADAPDEESESPASYRQDGHPWEDMKAEGTLKRWV